MHDLFDELLQSKMLDDFSTGFILKKRLLYVVNHSFPFSSNGYAIRTHSIAKSLVEHGLDIIVATRPSIIKNKGGSYGLYQEIDGVRYIHTHQPDEDNLSQSIEVIKTLIKVFKPSNVLAASNWKNGLIAALAAQEMNVPFYYEVRGFWEISRASKELGWGDSTAFRQEVEFETRVAIAAKQIFTINRHMRDELIRRGIDNKPISLVPNGFLGWEKPKRTLITQTISKSSLGIKTRYLVGYIGSFNSYEGLEDLIQAIAFARHQGIEISLLLVGSSEPMGLDKKKNRVCSTGQAYSKLAKRLGISNLLFLIGRIKPEEVASYYALLDVVVIPRKPVTVCEIVSPMKPLEAASYNKRVLMSDVAPLADLASLCPNFSYFTKGNVISLRDKMIEILEKNYAIVEKCHKLEGLVWGKNVDSMVKVFHGKTLYDNRKTF